MSNILGSPNPVTKWQTGTLQTGGEIKPGHSQVLKVSSYGETINNVLFFYSITALNAMGPPNGDVIAYSLAATYNSENAEITVTAGGDTTIGLVQVSWLAIGN